MHRIVRCIRSNIFHSTRCAVKLLENTNSNRQCAYMNCLATARAEKSCEMRLYVRNEPYMIGKMGGDNLHKV